MRNTKHWLSCWLLAAGFGLTGCAFAIDADLIKPDKEGNDASNSPDADPEDAGQPTSDAEGETADADTKEPDPDAGLVEDASEDADAEAEGGYLPPDTGPGPVALCTHDDECQEDQYCRSDGDMTCVSRCSEADGCALADEVAISNVVGDGEETAYYASGGGLDTFGNPLEPYRLWALRPDAQPTLVRDDLPSLPTFLFVADGYLYFQTQGELGRFPVDSSESAESIVRGASAVWRTSDRIWWSSQLAASAELWSMPSQGPTAPVRVATGDHAGWVGGNSQMVLRLVDAGDAVHSLLAEALPDLSTSRALGTTNADSFLVDEKAIYYEWSGVERSMIDLSRPPARLSLASTVATLFQLFGDGWVYWSVVSDSMLDEWGSSAKVFGRAHRDVPSAGGELWRTSYQVRSIAVLPKWVVLSNGRRLFVKANPPLPCGENLPCPARLTCSARQLCE